MSLWTEAQALLPLLVLRAAAVKPSDQKETTTEIKVQCVRSYVLNLPQAQFVMVNMCLRSTLIICVPSWVQSMNTEKTMAGKYNYDAKKK